MIRCTFTAPDGTPAPWYDVNLHAPGGRAAHTLDFALNEPAGAWRITARDVVTGRVAEGVVPVE